MKIKTHEEQVRRIRDEITAERVEQLKKMRLGDPISMSYGNNDRSCYDLRTYYFGIVDNKFVKVAYDYPTGHGNEFRVAVVDVRMVYPRPYYQDPSDKRINLFDELGLEVKEKAGALTPA